MRGCGCRVCFADGVCPAGPQLYEGTYMSHIDGLAWLEGVEAYAPGDAQRRERQPIEVWLAGGLFTVAMLFEWRRPLNYIPIAYAVVWALYLAFKSLGQSSYRLRMPPPLLVVGAWVVWAILSVMSAEHAGFALRHWLRFANMLGLGLLAANSISSLKNLRTLLYLVLVGVFIAVAVGWWQVGDLSVMRAWGWERRYVAFGFENANELGQAGLFCLVASVILFFTTRRGRRFERVVQLLGVAVALYVIWASGSRRELLNVPLLFLLIYFYHVLQKTSAWPAQKFAETVVLGVLLLGVAVWIAYAPYVGRLESFQQAMRGDLSALRAEPRAYLLRESLEEMVRHPILGMGPGYFRTVPRLGGHYSPHSEIGAIGSETGLPGLMIYLGWWAAWFIMLRRLRKRVTDPRHKAMLNCVFAFTVLLLISLPTQEHYRSKYMWLINGSAMGYAYSLRRVLDSEPDGDHQEGAGPEGYPV